MTAKVMQAIPGSKELNSVGYLYLLEVREPKDNSLRLVVREAVATGEPAEKLPSESPELARLREGATPIESTTDCRSFELCWRHYVAYCVTEELVGSSGDYSHECFDGKVFRLYSESNFLGHLRRDTGGHAEAVQHYKIVCPNHLVDVAAYGRPEIRVLDHLPARAGLIQ